MKYIIILTMIAVFGISCSEPAARTQHMVARDTTIQPQNAFTKLNLDSLAVAGFLLNNGVDDSTQSKMTGFYNARNYQYAWFTEDGLSEAGEAFWSLHEQQRKNESNSASEDQQLHAAMVQLLGEENAQLPADSVKQIELNLTLHFFQYVRAAFAGKIDPTEMQWNIPMRKLNSTALLDSFLFNNGRDLKPLNQSFYQLQQKVKQYAMIAKQGGWMPILYKGKSLKKGQRNDAVVALKKRLSGVDDFTITDTTNLFTAELVEAVKLAERSFGLTEDGMVTSELIEKLNVPAQERIQQMLINLERMRWLPEWPVDRLIANIPEFRLHVFENNKEELTMRVVVGKAANRTVIFSDELQFVVFSPYWNVPRSIVKNEIVPAMNRNSNYINRNNMEITGYSNGLPQVRQKPGAGNSLGRVKFIFPNRYNIYFHDTPAKSLFDRDSRAFSHGCVRLEKPFTLAQYLLRKDASWTDEKIKKAMNSQKEEWVKLKDPVPVYLLYLTAWVDKDGLLNFRDDIYGHDKRMADRLFTDPSNLKK